MADTTPNQTPQQTADNAGPTSSASVDSKSLTITGPFFPVDGNDKFRPYFSAPIEHEANTATIVLVKKTKTPPATSPVKDYFTDFSSKVKAAGVDIVSSSNGEIPDLDKINNGEQGKYFGIFKNFSLMGYQESRAEIAKVSLNFGLKWNAYFFGSQPRVYIFNGAFLDAKNYPYYEAFMRAYDNYLSGGKCVAAGFRMYIAYDGKITAGWMLGIDVTGSSDQRFMKTFSFRILIDDENWFRVNYEYDIDGFLLDKNSRSLTNTYQIPGVAKNLEISDIETKSNTANV